MWFCLTLNLLNCSLWFHSIMLFCSLHLIYRWKQKENQEEGCNVTIILNFAQIKLLHCLRDDHGFTPLHWACREGQYVVFEMLMARGARVSARNDGGDTPLHLACAHGNKDIVHKVMFAWQIVCFMECTYMLDCSGWNFRW